jgi:hypothetical protein
MPAHVLRTIRLNELGWPIPIHAPTCGPTRHGTPGCITAHFAEAEHAKRDSAQFRRMCCISLKSEDAATRCLEKIRQHIRPHPDTRLHAEAHCSKRRCGRKRQVKFRAHAGAHAASLAAEDVAKRPTNTAPTNMLEHEQLHHNRI